MDSQPSSPETPPILMKLATLTVGCSSIQSSPLSTSPQETAINLNPTAAKKATEDFSTAAVKYQPLGVAETGGLPTTSAYRYGTAASRVFGTVELLETILLNMKQSPQFLLCSAPRVNRMWWNVIQNSKTIQEWLYFKPIGRYEDYERPVAMNFFLQKFIGLDWNHNEDWDCAYNFGPTLCWPWPEGKLYTLEELDEHRDFDCEDPDLVCLIEVDWKKVEEDPRFTYPNASWRRMLAVQPPTPEVWYSCREIGFWGNSEERRDIFQPPETGKRLGDTYNSVLLLNSDPLTERTRTLVTTSQNYGIMVTISIQRKLKETWTDFLCQEAIPHQSDT